MSQKEGPKYEDPDTLTYQVLSRLYRIMRPIASIVIWIFILPPLLRPLMVAGEAILNLYNERSEINREDLKIKERWTVSVLANLGRFMIYTYLLLQYWFIWAMALIWAVAPIIFETSPKQIEETGELFHRIASVWIEMQTVLFSWISQYISSGGIIRTVANILGIGVLNSAYIAIMMSLTWWACRINRRRRIKRERARMNSQIEKYGFEEVSRKVLLYWSLYNFYKECGDAYQGRDNEVVAHLDEQAVMYKDKVIEIGEMFNDDQLGEL